MFLMVGIAWCQKQMASITLHTRSEMLTLPACVCVCFKEVEKLAEDHSSKCAKRAQWEMKEQCEKSVQNSSSERALLVMRDMSERNLLKYGSGNSHLPASCKGKEVP